MREGASGRRYLLGGILFLFSLVSNLILLHRQVAVVDVEVSDLPGGSVSNNATFPEARWIPPLSNLSPSVIRESLAQQVQPTLESRKSHISKVQSINRSALQLSSPLETAWAAGLAEDNAATAEHYLDGIVNNRFPPFYPKVDQTIRKWGCSRTEHPLIYVHIGKAGGGTVRARFAASAQNYNRSQWDAPKQDQHYYPLSKTLNATFCNSGHKNFRLPNTKLWPKSYEGNLNCTALTPIGKALACPQPARRKQKCLVCRDFSKASCPLVYVGHNTLGTEVHWLPPKYLDKWWKSTPWAQAFPIDFTTLISREDHKFVWCHIHNSTKNQTLIGSHSRPHRIQDYTSLFEDCSIPQARIWDPRFATFWAGTVANQDGSYHKRKDQQPLAANPISDTQSFLNFAPLYASMPLQRTILLREPFEWLVSKFFWHQRHLPDDSVGREDGFQCHDIESASQASLTHPGWAYHDVLVYLSYLCGDDCILRFEAGRLSLAELASQAESNLRRSFSVVGLLNETDQFFDMVSTRIAYVDLSRNPHVNGGRHSTQTYKEVQACKDIFANGTFQQAFKEALPLLKVLDDLYQIGVEVNRFQLHELRQCQSPEGKLGNLTN